ncbi:MAG: TyeA family type III secretion system gatekeeper subunit [Desulfobacteraceae bacterium]|nr:TyeA family type III secretion system gatekeeper subunit [Desulfobacteraceae bacterium]
MATPSSHIQANIVQNRPQLPIDSQKEADVGSIGASPDSHPVKGTLQGRQVTWVPDAGSMIKDGAEEAGFFNAENVSDRLSKMEKKGKKSAVAGQINKIAEFYLKKVPDLGSLNVLKSFLEALRTRGRNEGEISRLLDELFDDPVRRFAALAFALEALQNQKGNSRLLSTIQAMMDKLKSQYSSQITAGMNISATAAKYENDKFASTSELRNFYSNVVLAKEGIVETYKSIIAHFRDKNLPNAYKFLIDALGADMRSLQPSKSNVKLKLCMDDLYRLQYMGNLYRNVIAVLTTLQTKYKTGLGVREKDFYTSILEFIHKKSSMSVPYNKIVRQLKLNRLPPQIYFLSQLKNLVRLLPFRVFNQKHWREKLMTFIQDELDEVILKEEQELEEQQERKRQERKRQESGSQKRQMQKRKKNGQR